MRRKLLALLLTLVIGLTACGSTAITYEYESSDQSMFVLVEHGTSYKIVYHRDTKVMYAISDSSSNYGTFTVMLDADGSPLLYEE